MVVADPAWEAFRQALKYWMDEKRHISAPALARELGVSSDTVNNWRKGTKPRLSDLPRISQALTMGGSPEMGHDPTWLLAKMGLLEPAPDVAEVYGRAFQLHSLRLSEIEALDNLASVAGRSQGAAAVLSAAMTSAKWAVAVWPSMDGPEDCRMRVADRLDLRRTDGMATDATMVWDDPDLRGPLRASFAYPSEQQPRWTTGRNDLVSKWTIPYVGAPRPPRRAMPHPGIETIACTALTVESWVHEVGSLVAIALGYGQSTTRALSIEVAGVTPAGRVPTSGRSDPHQRRRAHDYFLSHPPGRRVWTHSALPDKTFPSPIGPAGGRVVQVWLRESDELLQEYLNRWNPSTSLKTAIRHRSNVEVAAQRSGALIIDVTRCKNSAERWEQALKATLTILHHLSARAALTVDSLNLGHALSPNSLDRDVAGPLLAWLAASGWPPAAV